MTRFYPSYPKINVFLKIVGIATNGYCKIHSRFVKVVNGYYDTLQISDSKSFGIKGDCGCKVESNTIFLAKEALKDYLIQTQNPKANFLENFCIEVDKNIPIFAGLGGGSSNAATYLLAMNEILELGLQKDTLSEIATKVGSDVSFFVFDYGSANVSGVGEKVQKFDEILGEIEIFTPDILCQTKAVYDEFKAKFPLSQQDWFLSPSKEILSKYDIYELNDLFAPALNLYPNLIGVAGELAKDGYFFSGSGSSFFRLKD